jgi:glycerol-3-phosphate dehydrogenase
MSLAMPSLSTELLVVGAGATGLGVAWDAALRGIKVVIIDQGDLGQGTSGRFHGLLHSGGRYVLSDPDAASACARENRILRRIAPHAIEDTGGYFLCAPGDPEDFPDKWLEACRRAGVPAREVTTESVLRREPLVNPKVSRAFEVQDAAIDSFDLMHSLADGIRAHGGQVWLRHRLERLIVSGARVSGAEILSLATGERTTVGAEFVVNAAGPWASLVAGKAGLSVPTALGKGCMVAMATRLIHTVLNRCKVPSDGDILVPIGTVTVLGTTDVPVQSPDQLMIEPEEIDLLLAEGEILIPSLPQHRPLRAWSGIRPLYRPATESGATTRELPRSHYTLDHAKVDGLSGFLSIIGGKLVTFRLMAQEAMVAVCDALGSRSPCTTAEQPILPSSREFHALPARLERVERPLRGTKRSPIVCECELVTEQDFAGACQQDPMDLDDIRRDLRLGMGPCQAGFCAYRASGLAQRWLPHPPPSGGFHTFIEERWRGARPLGWGTMLRQLELSQRLTLELLAAHRLRKPVDD